MSRPSNQPNAPLLGRFIAHLRVPLYRNGYALILTSITTSALGVLYWILAARTYTTEMVGLNAAAIAAMTFISGVAQFNLMSALVRFIPTSGKRTLWLVLIAYLVSTLITLLVSLCFVIGFSAFGQHSPTLDFLTANPFIMTLFVLATGAWTIFTLQDSVMTGLGQAIWVPIENTVFALMKLGLLLGLAPLFPQYGIFAAWTVAFIVCIPPINFLIFRYLIPKHVRAKSSDASPPSVGQIAKYVAGDYGGSLFWLACTDLQPVLVVLVAGATANAYFYLAWSIVYSIYNVSSGMGLSLVVEAAREPAKLGLYSYRAFQQVARLVVPLVLGLMLGAPYILQIFGSDYAAEGTALLQLLAFSAIPNIVNALYLAVARAQRRMRVVVTMLAAFCVGILSLGYVLLKIYGIVGIGWAWVIVQSVMAAIVLMTQFGPLWAGRQGEGGSSAGGMLSRLSQGRETWLRFCVLGLYAVSVRLGWWSFLREKRGAVRSERDGSPTLRLLSSILRLVPAEGHLPAPTTWVAQQRLQTVNDVKVIALGPRGQLPVAVLKLPQSEQAVNGLKQHRRALEALRTDGRLSTWVELLPMQWAEGRVHDQSFVVEQLMPGIDARRLQSDAEPWVQMQVTAAQSIGILHQHTAVTVWVDEPLRGRWIDEPCSIVRQVTDRLPRAAHYARAIECISKELHESLGERRVPISWIHGDFAPDNLLVTFDGKQLLGIVDWELGATDELPLLDLVQLFLSVRALEQAQELGAIVCGLLHRADWHPHERELLDSAQRSLPGEPVAWRTLLLLCWLKHVASNLNKSTHYASHWIWIRQNIESVLQFFEMPGSNGNTD